MDVEALRLVVLGVDQEHPDPDRLGHLEGFEHEVLQERRSETASGLESTAIRASRTAGISSGWFRCMDFGVADRSIDAVADA